MADAIPFLASGISLVVWKRDWILNSGSKASISAVDNDSVCALPEP
jgi:hypothetical protein